jgi:hypothetical protein
MPKAAGKRAIRQQQDMLGNMLKKSLLDSL